MFTNEIYSEWMKENQISKYMDMKSILQHIKGNILDVGIGPGWFEDFFGIKSIGIDTDKKSVANVIASGDHIPFKDSSFNCIVCIDTVHLLKGKDIKRVLKKYGLLIVSRNINKDNEKDIEEKLLNMFKEFKLLERKTVGKKEKDLVLLLEKK